jgi:hypothetical protein
MARKLTLAIVVASILVALGVTATQATTALHRSVPSGAEVIPYIFHDTGSEIGWASSIKLYDTATRKSETISGPGGTDSYLSQPQLSEDGKYVFFLDYYDFSTDPDGNLVRQESIGYVPTNGGVRSRIVTTGVMGTIAEYDVARDGSKVLYLGNTYNEEGSLEGCTYSRLRSRATLRHPKCHSPVVFL